MILCTYQPHDFKFDVCPEYNAFDNKRRESIKLKVGNDYINDYSKLLGKETKPIFCFEAIRNSVQTAVKSKFVSPTNPEKFILFETDESICYNDILWNGVYGKVPVDDTVKNKIIGQCEFESACHVVDKISQNSVIFECDIEELLKNNKLYGKARLHKNERKEFAKILPLVKEWYSSYEIKLMELYGNESNSSKFSIKERLSNLRKHCFENFYLPIIIRQCLGLDEPLYCMNPFVSSVPVQVNDGKTDMLSMICNIILEFSRYHSISDFETKEDATRYRTGYLKDVFELCCLLFDEINNITNDEDLEIKKRMCLNALLISQTVQRIGIEHTKYVKHFMQGGSYQVQK